MGRGQDETGSTAAFAGFSPLYGHHPRRQRVFVPHPTVEIHQDGSRTERWHDQEGREHRDHDRPAVIRTTPSGIRSSEIYCRHGKTHRDRKPAVIEMHADGSRLEAYYRDGVLHRNGAPAMTTEGDGERTEYYYRHGKAHRDDGPALIRTREDERREEFWIDGKRESGEDSPAVVIESLSGTAITTEYSNANWQLHRSDGPARVTRYTHDQSVTREYWVNGARHRDDGPAIVDTDADGSVRAEQYYKHGKRHREDGPAYVIHGSPECLMWYLDDERLTAQEFALRKGVTSARPTGRDLL